MPRTPAQFFIFSMCVHYSFALVLVFLLCVLLGYGWLLFVLGLEILMLCLCVVVMAYQPPTDLQLRDPEFQRVTERSSVPVPSTRASTGPSTSCPTESASKRSTAASPVKSSKRLLTEQAVSTTRSNPCNHWLFLKRKGRSQCPVCDKKPNCSLCHHALVHLPWYGDPVKVCWECGEHFTQHRNLHKHLQSRHPNRHFNNHTSRWVTLLANLFHIITKHLQLSKVQDLVGYVIKHHLFPEPGEPSPDDQEMMRLFDITSHHAVPPQGYCYSPPNSVAALTHWKILVLLIQWLNPSCKLHVFNMQFSTIRSASGFPAPSPGVPLIFEILTVPVPGTHAATFSQPGPSPVALGPSQDHRPPPLVAGLPKGPPRLPCQVHCLFKLSSTGQLPAFSIWFFTGPLVNFGFRGTSNSLVSIFIQSECSCGSSW